VRWLAVVQAQDYAGATWAVGQRTQGATAAALDRLFDAGDILRTPATASVASWGPQSS
jgi:hypothetical protein